MKLNKHWILSLILMIIMLIAVFLCGDILFDTKSVFEERVLYISRVLFGGAVTLVGIGIVYQLFNGPIFYKDIIIPHDGFSHHVYPNHVIIVIGNKSYSFPRYMWKFIRPKLKDGLPITEYYNIRKKILRFDLHFDLDL